MFIVDGGKRFVIPRTQLTYPCHKLKMHQNAAKADVDQVMADFEDACPTEFKGEPSHKTMVEGLNSVDFGQKIVTVRPNNIESKYFRGDLEAIMLGAPDRFHGIILPKPSKAEDIRYLARFLTDLERAGGWKTRVMIEALIETPISVINAYEIATSSDRMVGLIFGIADFAAAMGVRDNVTNQNINFLYAKQHVIVAAKAAGLHAIDNGYMRIWRADSPQDEIEDIKRGLREKSEGSAAMGMDGTWVIHPQQAEIANAAFTANDDQIEEAKYVLDYYHEQGGGAIYVPAYKKFHDEATIKGVLMELAKAAQAGKVDQDYLYAMAKKSEEITGYNILEGAGGTA